MTKSSCPWNTLKRDEWTWSRFNDQLLQEFQALIVNYEQKTVLLGNDGVHWFMPGFVGDEDNYESSLLPEFVKDKIREVVGLKADLCVLRQVWRDEMKVVKDNVQYTLEKAVVLVKYFCGEDKRNDGMEVVTDQGLTRDYVWVPLVNADVYHLFPDARKVIADEIKWVIQDQVPEGRLSWQRPGWLESTTSWMKDILLRNLGTDIIKPVYVERLSRLGTVIIADTTKGNYFLKCTPPWENDAAFTEALSRIVPKFVASPVAVDSEKQIMITGDYGQILQPIFFDIGDIKKLTVDFVSLQQEVSKNVDELIDAGMPDFRESALMRKMDWIMSSTSLMERIGKAGYREEISCFQNNIGFLKAQVQELHRTGVAPTVLHNDLGLSNVYRKGGCENFMIFDWVMGYVAHPLAGELDGLDNSIYVNEWEKYIKVEGFGEKIVLGARVHILIEAILTIQEAERVEKEDCMEVIKEAGQKLESLRKEYGLKPF